MPIQRERIDYNREKRVLVNLILSTQFCEAVLPVIDDRYFKSKYAGYIIDWVKEYYNIYGVAPKLHINEVFEEAITSIDPDMHSQIGNILQHTSDVSSTEIHNVKYLIDIANDLFREKHLQLQNEIIQNHLNDGDLVAAEMVMQENYVGIKGSSKRFIAFDDEEFTREYVRDMVMQADDTNAFFKFSGKLGDFLGPMDRGWFVAFLAPAKRGKTTYMLDAAIDSIRQHRNTVVISLEMPEKQLMQRYSLAITGVKPEEGKYEVMLPIMDCILNQNGECKKSERIGGGSVMVDGGLVPYEDEPDWKVCDACRGTKEFKPTSWKIKVEKNKVNEGNFVKKIRKFNKFFGKYGRVIHFPSKCATIQDLKDAAEFLENEQNFIPDVIVLDYADLIKPDPESGGEKRHQLDDIWEYLRGWAQEKRMLLISASQTNRVSAEAKYIKDIHVAEDYSKIAKLDVAIGLCQTDKLKESGIMNINKVAHRHREYLQSQVCTVLQEMSHQQSSLDSEFHQY